MSPKILKVPKTYYDPTQPNIQKVINPTTKKILVMGCGAGALGLAIKQKLKTEVWGVESNNALSNYAKSKLDKVIVSNFDDSVSSLPDNYFGSIIFESLEHLSLPYHLLTSIKHKLIPGGEVLAQITNILQWPVLKNLIEGYWEYDHYGVMDKRHLRFYTKRSINELFLNSGYYVSDIGTMILPENQVPEDILIALSKTDIDQSAIKEESGFFQFIIKGIKPVTEKSKLHNEAESLLNDGQYKLAKEIYTSLYSETPYSTETIFGLALCMNRLNDSQSAIQLLKHLLEIHPEHSNAYNQLGIIYFEQGNVESAGDMFIEAIMKFPKSIEAKCNYARVLLEQGEYEYSLQVLENILENKPDDIETILSISIVYKQSGDLQKAIHFARKSLDVDATNKEAEELLKALNKSIVHVNEKESTEEQANQDSSEIDHSKNIIGLTKHNIPKQPEQRLASETGKFFLNSIPKGGTNLLSKVVSLFPGIDFSQISISRPDSLEDLPLGNLGMLSVGRDSYMGKMSEWNSMTKAPIGVDWPIMENLEKIFFILTMLRNGKYAMGHVPYSNNLSMLLSKMVIKTFLILRDPRDVVISHAFFISKNPYNTSYKLYKHLSTHERIMTSIVGISEDKGFGIKILNIKERIESLLPWMHFNNNCTVFFEKLVGPQGLGSLDMQHQELTKISSHLGFNYSHQEIENLASKIFGGTETFRKGEIGDWKNHMSDEHKDVCKKLIGQILIDLGYEKDLEW